MAATKTEGPSCGRCRHWGDAPVACPPKRVEALGLRACKMVGHVDSAEDDTTDLAFTSDAECYAAWLLTRAEFYCAYFEETDRG